MIKGIIMNFRSRIPFLFLGFFVVRFVFVPQADASKLIAKASSFKGEVIVLSDTKIVGVTKLGQILNQGNRIQTKQGEVKIAFKEAKAAAEETKDIGKEVIEAPPEVPAPPEPYVPPEVPGFELLMDEEPPIRDTEPASPI